MLYLKDWATETANQAYTSFCSNVHKKKKSQVPHFVIFNFPSMKCYTNTFLHCHFQHIMHKSELKKAVNLFKREVRKKRRGQES